jgi:hypothetical protein
VIRVTIGTDPDNVHVRISDNGSHGKLSIDNSTLIVCAQEEASFALK